MLARDPQHCADIVLSFLMRIHAARAGAIFAVDRARTQLFVGNGIDQRALEWTAASWTAEQRSLEQGRMSRHDERFLVPVLRDRELTSLVYLATSQVDLASIDEVAGLISDAVLRGARESRTMSPVEVYLERTPVGEIERRRLLMLLERHEWNLARVARELRVTRTTVYKRLRAFGIARPHA
jgi:transcriptional regulator with GAF, ATPase, and Fis domain